VKHKTLLLLMMTGCGPCRSCDPELPESDTEQDTRDRGTNTQVDTAPPPPCDLPEEEPNNGFDQAGFLPLELQACGDIDPLFDTDNWRFDVPVTQWMGVYLHATSIGSLSDVALILIDEDDVSIEVRSRDSGEQDVELVFPAPLGEYTALVVDENLQGGPDDYFYELLVGEAKQPVEYNVVEIDAEQALDGQILEDEDVVFGTFFEPEDTDWYQIPIPADTASVELVIEALQHGSPADIRLELYESTELNFIGTILSAADGTTGDPADERSTTGDTVWFIKVVDRQSRGSFAHWYTLSVDLKGAE
jgi:hypothetical protein